MVISFTDILICFHFLFQEALGVTINTQWLSYHSFICLLWLYHIVNPGSLHRAHSHPHKFFFTWDPHCVSPYMYLLHLLVYRWYAVVSLYGFRKRLGWLCLFIVFLPWVASLLFSLSYVYVKLLKSLENDAFGALWIAHHSKRIPLGSRKMILCFVMHNSQKQSCMC